MVLIGSALLIAVLVASAGPRDALAALNRLRLSPHATPAAVGRTLDEGIAALDEPADRAGSPRSERCRDAFLAGELYRVAASALASSDDRAADYTDEALQRFRAMRVEFLDLLEGGLGYVGEARVLRQRGDGHEALAVLGPLLQPDADPRIRRLATLEAIEATLLVDVDAAIERAIAFGPGAEWALARAHARRGGDEEALALARREDVVRRTPAYDRLRLISTLGALTDDERAAWADLLVALGRTAEARETLEDRCPDGSAPLLAALLEGEGRWVEAAERWRHAAAVSGDPSHELAAARCLTTSGAGAGRTQAIALYERVITGAGRHDIRREALRRYTSLVGHDAARSRLESNDTLVDGDLFLRYARAAARRSDADRTGLIGELEAIAREADDDALRAAAVLLRAQIEPDPRRGLQIVDEHWDLLTSHASTADGAQRLRTTRWLDLGMIDGAADAMAAEPTRHSSAALLTVADALADRADDGFGAETPARIVRLAAAAIRRSPTDFDVAIDAARIMLRVGATADADRVLATIATPEARLLRADIARRLDRPREALELLGEGVTTEAALLRGRCLLDLGRARDALTPIRAARRRAREGSDIWWEATIALAQGQLDLGNREAAAAVIRVATTLHPVGEKRPFRGRLKNLSEELD